MSDKYKDANFKEDIMANAKDQETDRFEQAKRDPDWYWLHGHGD